MYLNLGMPMTRHATFLKSIPGPMAVYVVGEGSDDVTYRGKVCAAYEDSK